jgi:hypothetical protein
MNNETFEISINKCIETEKQLAEYINYLKTKK